MYALIGVLLFCGVGEISLLSIPVVPRREDRRVNCDVPN